MHDDKSLKQRLWWLAIARRMLGWGLAMAALWSWFPFLFGGELALLYLLKPEWIQNSPNDDGGFGDLGIFIALIIPFAFTCLWALGGAVAGGLAGFFAPATEPKNPFKSRFFRSVGRQAFWFWFWSSLGATLCHLLILSSSWLRIQFPVLDALTAYFFYAVLAALPVLAIWRALSRTLKAQALQTREAENRVLL